MAYLEESQKLNSIEVYRDVSFNFPMARALELRNAMVKCVYLPWREAPEWEAELMRKNSEAEKNRYISFNREPDNKYVSCYVTLHALNEDEDSWVVPNVVPKDFGDRIAMDQYNEIIEEFVTFSLEPALTQLKSTVTMSPKRFNLTDMFDEESLIHLWNVFANGGYDGAMHPNDEKELCRFIYCVHKSGKDYNVGLFRRWLIEVGCWRETIASEFANRIDQGQTLLAYVDQPRS